MAAAVCLLVTAMAVPWPQNECGAFLLGGLLGLPGVYLGSMCRRGCLLYFPGLVICWAPPAGQPGLPELTPVS